jgi:hypothetical protein
MATHPQVVLAGGHYHLEDKLGVHGGYKEGLKSQIIDPRYISRFWKVDARAGRSQQIFLGWDEVNDNLTPAFTCGNTYHLRLDVKGDKALRFIGKNLSRRFTVFTGCCTNAGSPEQVDPVVVLLEFARQINEDPILSPFVRADIIIKDGGGLPDTVDPETYVPATTPTDIANVVVGLQLTVVFRTETNFYTCSFDPNDYFESEQLVITSAQLVNEEGKDCADFTPLALTEKQNSLSPEGTQAQVLRDFLLSISYRQEFFSTNPRMRTVAGFNRIVDMISSNLRYTCYYILHQVPRHSNPTGVYDEDQYLIQVAFNPSDTVSQDFLANWLQSYLSSAGSGVVLEDLSGEPDGG